VTLAIVHDRQAACGQQKRAICIGEAIIELVRGGDGFNAGYLAARLSGRSAAEAAQAAHQLADPVTLAACP